MRDNDFNFLPFIISFLTKISVIIGCDNVQVLFSNTYSFISQIFAVSPALRGSLGIQQ